MVTPFSKSEYNKAVREGWGEFITRYPWEWFATLTFVVDTHPESALKLMRLWCSMLNRKLYGRNWQRQSPGGAQWILSIEYQKRGVIHLHVLMMGVKDARRLTWMDNWEELRPDVTGFARIEPVNNKIAASLYLCKYVAKDGEIFFSEGLKDATDDLFYQEEGQP